MSDTDAGPSGFEDVMELHGAIAFDAAVHEYRVVAELAGLTPADYGEIDYWINAGSIYSADSEVLSVFRELDKLAISSPEITGETLARRAKALGMTRLEVDGWHVQPVYIRRAFDVYAEVIRALDRVRRRYETTPADAPAQPIPMDPQMSETIFRDPYDGPDIPDHVEALKIGADQAARVAAEEAEAMARDQAMDAAPVDVTRAKRKRKPAKDEPDDTGMVDAAAALAGAAPVDGDAPAETDGDDDLDTAD